MVQNLPLRAQFCWDLVTAKAIACDLHHFHTRTALGGTFFCCFYLCRRKENPTVNQSLLELSGNSIITLTYNRSNNTGAKQ